MLKTLAGIFIAVALFAGGTETAAAKTITGTFFEAELPEGWQEFLEGSTRSIFFSRQDKYILTYDFRYDDEGFDKDKRIPAKGAGYFYEDEAGARYAVVPAEDRFGVFKVSRPYPGLRDFLDSIKVDEGWPELASAVEALKDPKFFEWLSFTTPSPNGLPVPTADSLSEDDFPIAMDANTPEWIGSYCRGKKCITVHNMRLGPMGYYLMLSCEDGGKTLGGASVPVSTENGHEAGYSNLLLSLNGDGKTLEAAPMKKGARVDAEDAWINACMGVYQLKE